MNNIHETRHLKCVTINIKYEYLCNREHETSTMKHPTENMKLKRKYETGKKFGVFKKLIRETFNIKHETSSVKYGTY